MSLVTLQGMDRAIITRSPLVVTKMFGNVACGVVRTIVKSYQRIIVVLEATVSHS